MEDVVGRGGVVVGGVVVVVVDGGGGSQGTFNRQGTFNGRGGGNFRSKEWSRCDNCENSNGDKDITHTSSSVNTTTD